MNILPLAMALASLAVVMTTIIHYFRGIAQAKVTLEITGMVSKLVFGIALGAAAIVVGYQDGTLGAAILVPTIFSVMVASGVLWLLTQRKTPIGDLKVEVGDSLLAFEARTGDGTRFHSSELAGQRTLLKFFRGGW